jgi:hypothetical protein
MTDFERELGVLIRACYPLIYLQTAEEPRAEETIKRLAQERGKRLYVWTLTRGYEPPIPAPTEAAASRPLAPELEAIAQLLRLQDDALVVLKDFHPYLSDTRVIRLLRDLYPRLQRARRTVVFLAPILKLPPELEKQITVLEMPLPTRDEIAHKIQEILLVLKASQPDVRTELTPQELDELVSAAQGLTMDEIENVCARSIVEHKSLRVDAILSEKEADCAQVGRAGVLRRPRDDAGCRRAGSAQRVAAQAARRAEPRGARVRAARAQRRAAARRAGHGQEPQRESHR